MEPNQPPSFVKLLTRDVSKGEMSNSSNNSSNPKIDNIIHNTPNNLTHPQQNPSHYPPPQNPSHYPLPQNPSHYPAPQNPSYMYGTMPCQYYPPQPPLIASSTPHPQDKKNKTTNEGGGLGAK